MAGPPGAAHALCAAPIEDTGALRERSGLRRGPDAGYLPVESFADHFQSFIDKCIDSLTIFKPLLNIMKPAFPLEGCGSRRILALSFSLACHADSNIVASADPRPADGGRVALAGKRMKAPWSDRHSRPLDSW
jgi:hypothetical protein